MSHTNIIKNARVTEKATDAMENNAYVFNISPRATKKEVEKAINAIYKVKPVKVNILRVPRKRTTFKGQAGSKGGGKKAVVYLKKDDKLELI